MSLGNTLKTPRPVFYLAMSAAAFSMMVCSSSQPDSNADGGAGEAGGGSEAGAGGGNGAGAAGGTGGGDANNGGSKGGSTAAGGNSGAGGSSAGAGGSSGGGAGGSSGGAGGVPGAGGSPPVVCDKVPELKLTTVAYLKDQAFTLVVQPSKASPLFAVQRRGIISILKAGAVVETPFLDLRQSVSGGGERGLLGLAFHRNYDTNGRFFVFYTKRRLDPVAAGDEGNIVIAEGKRSSNPEVAEPAIKRLVMVNHSIHANHNGGMIAFGPDGKLFAGVGDGGGQNDPFKAPQKLDDPLGKILRIDVDDPGARPAGNMPAPANVHVWAYGLRNPWRLSFDRENSDLYIADVGQEAWEEINVVPAAAQQAGLNFGWSVMEGTHCFQSDNCDKANKVLPVTEYANPPDTGRSVVGGYVYRGSKMPCLRGRYFYGDHNTNQVWSFVYSGGKATLPLEMTSALATESTRIQGLATFGQDADGELYLADILGNIYRIDPK